MNTLKARLSTAAISAALAMSGFLLNAPAAHAANSGYVMCADQSAIVGIWVDVKGGRSGWAARGGSGHSQTWSYNTQGREYALHVGCGGTPMNWRTNVRSGYTKTGYNLNCFPGTIYGSATIVVANGCRWT